jgi:hypothetical protein
MGLALGICTCLVIYLIVSFELQFDAFHPDRQRIYRIVGTKQDPDGSKGYLNSVPPGAAPAIREQLTGVETAASLYRLENAKAGIRRSNRSIETFPGRANGVPTIVVAEPQYFDIFQYTWLAGIRQNALDEPFRVVLTQGQAKRYFGPASPDRYIGRVITYNDSLRVTVSGILKDWDQNTDLGFTDFISFSTVRASFLKNDLIRPDDWTQHYSACWCFLKLNKSTQARNIDAQLSAFARSHIRLDPGAKLALNLQPLSDLHFDDRYLMDDFRKAHLPTLYALVGIALFILILAIINFINLSTAESIRRCKEIGIRRVLGGGRPGLMIQFLTETFLLILIALLLSLLLVWPVLSLFGAFIPKGVVFHFFDGRTWAFLLLVLLVTTLLAGIYPAFVLSSYRPALTIKGQLSHSRGAGLWLRQGLIVFQFTIAIVFIVGALVANRQLWYTRHKDLGFAPDAVITIPGGNNPQSNKVLVEKIKMLAGVNGVALQSFQPLSAAHIGGVSVQLDAKSKVQVPVSILAGDENIVSLYRMRLLAGKGLSGGDTTKDIVVNVSCAKALGFADPAALVGRTLNFLGKDYPVAGVIADYHDHSFHEPIEPIVIFHLPVAENSLAVRLNFGGGGPDIPGSGAILGRIACVWAGIYPGTAFSYSFLDDEISKLYEKDEKIASLIDTAMGITIFISCMGVFGLVLFSTERRKKEISIRKVLGATVGHITMMLSRDFLLLVPVALLIASPVAWYFTQEWLRGFVYRVPIGWWVFAAAGLAIVGVTWLTVNVLGIRTARANPVLNLRTE